jgi:hypothetical protein
VRNGLVSWELNDRGEVMLQVPRREDRVGRLLSRVFAAPEHRQIVLDTVGSEVWQLCTGRNSVDALVRALSQQHKFSRREAELSLSRYLQQLARRGLVGLSRVPVEEAQSAEPTPQSAPEPCALSPELEEQSDEGAR